MTADRKHITKVRSVTSGRGILHQKDLLDEVEEMYESWRDREGGPNKVLAEFDWETEYGFSIGKNRPRFDGFEKRVGLEHETREQMNIRSHLLWAETGFQRDAIDAGVFLI